MKKERDGRRENGSEEEAEDTEKGRTCQIKIERKIIKQTGFKNKAQSHWGTSTMFILDVILSPYTTRQHNQMNLNHIAMNLKSIVNIHGNNIRVPKTSF